MRIAAIIQARMKSTRLPGKVLMEVGGRPVLEHIVRRLRACATLSEIAITTSTEPEDDAIVAFGAARGVAVFRGPEANVLERFAIAARALDPDILVRVTGDSPLVDPEIIDHLVCEMARTGADFLALRPGVKCILEGVDPFSRRALRVLLGEAADDPVAREHVTGWLKAHGERVRVAEIAIDPAWEFSGARLSIDTPADLEFFTALASRVDLDTVTLAEVAALLKCEPWLLAINAHVRQKAARDREATVLLRADGGGMLGYGHLTRTAAVAEALRDKEGVGVVALTGVHAGGNAKAARAFFEARKIPVVLNPNAASEIEFILEEARRRRASALVLDVRTGLSLTDVDKLRASGLKIAVVDDASERRLAADIVAYPPVPQAATLDWEGLPARGWSARNGCPWHRTSRGAPPMARQHAEIGWRFRWAAAIPGAHAADRDGVRRGHPCADRRDPRAGHRRCARHRRCLAREEQSHGAHRARGPLGDIRARATRGRRVWRHGL
ncbi:MAG: NTP transferase domain-containing protein [Alphaproteobacteria bacterium]